MPAIQPNPPRDDKDTVNRLRTTLALPALALALTGCATLPSAPTAQPANEPAPATSTAPATPGSPAAPAVKPTAPASKPAAPTDLPAYRTAPYTDSSQVNTAVARARLALIPVKGRAPKTGYDRTSTTNGFGTAWKDTDRNGCDTRNDVLARDGVDETFKPGTRDCVVLTATVYDPYTDMTLAFERGQATSGKVQIDHLIALSDGWQKGAQQWTQDKREAFANDPLNLLAVDGPTNSSKGDSDAATWLPPNKAYRCAFAASIIEVKSKYGVTATAAEHAVLATLLDTCPKQ